MTAWREKKLHGVVLTISGVSGNAATRLESFVTKNGAFAYGALPEVDDLFRRQAGELDRKKREALLHQIQRILHEQVIQAPIYHLGFPDRRRAARGRHHGHRHPRLLHVPLRGPQAPGPLTKPPPLGYHVGRCIETLPRRGETTLMRYEAPDSLDQAVALLAGSPGRGARAGRRHRPPGADARRRRRPRADRRHQEDPRDPRGHRGEGRLAHRRRGDGRRAQGARRGSSRPGRAWSRPPT